MNRKLQQILSSQELKNVFNSLLLQDQQSQTKMILHSESMMNQKRLSANIIDIFLHSQTPPTQTIDQVVTTFKEYCEGIFETEPTDNLTFLKFFRDRLKNELFRGLFTRSDNSEVLQNYKIDPTELAAFREDILKISTFLKPNKNVLKDKLFLLIAQDNLLKFQEYVTNCKDSDLNEMYDRYMEQYNAFIKAVPPEKLTSEVKAVYEVLSKTSFVESFIQLPAVYQANDNLPYRKIRRNVRLDFKKDHFDTLKLFSNLIQCYELGFADQNIMFNGEYFYDYITGERLIQSNNPITLQNIQTVGRFNQTGFVLPEHLVYGFQNTPLANEFSFTLSQENVTGGEQYRGFGYPLLYATKNGFFGQKKCKFAKTLTTTNPQNQQVQCTYSYYTSVENDTGEKYVKVVEQNLETQQISIALYVYPLNHINAGIQICRVDSNDPTFTFHNIGGKERIETIFHMHKYNIIDQVRKSGEGEFDIMLKFDDNLTPELALELFDDVCKTADTPEKMYDENNNEIEVVPTSHASKPLSQKQIEVLQEEALQIPFNTIMASFFDNNEELEEEYLTEFSETETQKDNSPTIENGLTTLLIEALKRNTPPPPTQQ